MIAEDGLGLAYLTVAGAAPIDQIEAAAAAGCSNVGLRLVAPLGLTLPHEIIGNAPLVRAIRSACRDAGVRVYDVDALTLAAGTDMAHLHAAVEAGAELGADVVQLVVEDPERQRAIDRFAALCDAAPARIPPQDEQLLPEARGLRLYPGEGELWPDELLDVLPPRIPISVEIPRDNHAHLGVNERAQLAADATRAWLARHRAKRVAR
jgi:sugar phosphate isomerase/epimerase